MLLKKIAVFMAVSVLTVTAFFSPLAPKKNVSAQSYSTDFQFAPYTYDNATAYTYYILRQTDYGSLSLYYYYINDLGTDGVIRLYVDYGNTTTNQRIVTVSYLSGSQWVQTAVGAYPYNTAFVLYIGVSNTDSMEGLTVDIGYMSYHLVDNVYTFTTTDLHGYMRGTSVAPDVSKWTKTAYSGNNSSFGFMSTTMFTYYALYNHFTDFMQRPFGQAVLALHQIQGTDVYYGDYYDGYLDGLAESDTIQGFIPRLFASVSHFFITVLGGISLFGVSLWSILITLLAVAVVAFFIKFIT